MRTVTALILILLILPSTLWSGILITIAPHTDMVENVGHVNTIHYYFPEYSDDGQFNYRPYYTNHSIQLGITEEEYSESSERKPIRMYSKVNDYDSYIEPDDKYVQMVAKELRSQIDSREHDYTEAQIASVALMFVRSAVTYQYDENQYGWEEYYAFPMETLYTCRGDCEDVAILYVSIARAMGIDAVLVHFPHHVAGGVKLADWKGDVGEYSLMECTSKYNAPLYPPMDEGEIMTYSKSKVMFDSANQMWRKNLHDYLGWIHPRI